MARLRGLLAALLLAATPAPAQDASTLAWMEGQWQGPGTMQGNASEASLDVRPVLGGRFVELRYRAGGFEGMAVYQHIEADRWRATWFDNRGISFPIDSRLAGRTLTSDWGSAETERGRTTYRLLEDGRLELTDSVPAPDGNWRVFARHILTRSR